MKKTYLIFSVLLIILLNSCKSIIANPGKALDDNFLEIGKRYEIQDYEAKVHQFKITSVDSINVYGVSKKGKCIVINKKQIREVKKLKVGTSIIVSISAIAALIFIPI
ncbi:bacteriophage spanin2 family protein [Epilithonimonas zeae]|uniref:Uncharacterized protein n=1 Tax=Epilithonimonas zeae TaxID=1416779 RepID=A0A1N6EW48_9FLAO|nr:bacteriophage spanin2 family protein [Epilithonimonas zeae]SIN87216.1 hypothetical protein SAMN05444409_0889 [Epilithonimonas zeae]